MKVMYFLSFSLGGIISLAAQEPSIKGGWQVGEQAFGYRAEGGDREPENISSEVSSISFAADGSFTTSSESGTWLFSDDFLLAIRPGELVTVAVSVTGDTLILAQGKDSEIAPGVFERERNMAVGIKEATTDFGVLDIGGGLGFASAGAGISRIASWGRHGAIFASGEPQPHRHQPPFQRDISGRSHFGYR